MQQDFNFILLDEVCDGYPGVIRICLELHYIEQHPEAMQKLVELGITWLDLCLLYKACGDSAAAVICRISDGTATALLKANPESTFYQPLEDTAHE
jgi:hypothetical protein